MKDLDLQDKDLVVKIIREAIDKRECKQFETALQHNSKLRAHRELKGEEYLKYLNGAASRLFLSSVWVPMGCLRNWVGILMGMGLKNVVIVGHVRSQLSMYFLNVHHTIPKDKIFRLLLKTSNSSGCV